MDSDWGEVVTRYPYRKVRMDHLLSRENKGSLEEVLLIYMLEVGNRTMGNE